jgi:phenylalanyl-tRNA synthetase beta chain
MRASGYSEALTYPFESPTVFDKLLLPPEDPRRNAVRIRNPLSEDFSVMRTVTLAALLESLSLNFNRRNESARLYELAYVYVPKSLPLTELPDERLMLTAAAYGKDGMDFFAVKGLAEELLANLGLAHGAAYHADTEGLPFMHPGRTAVISVSGKKIGWLGEVHPLVLEKYHIGERAYVLLLEMELLFALASSVRTTVTPPPRFPSVHRDIAVTVRAEVPAAAVEAAIREKAGPLLTEVRLFDVYQGIQVEEGFKSMAFGLTFRSAERTLVDGEVTAAIEKILENLSRRHGASLRNH